MFGKFYESLARGRGIATALDDARTHLDSRNPQKYEVRRGDQRRMLALHDWFLPALFHGGADAPMLANLPSACGRGARAGFGDTGSKTMKHNLRSPHEAGFFGRRRELWDIARWFATAETRRISLTGFGGQGKTELALEAGRWLVRAGRFERAVFVDYSQVQAAGRPRGGRQRDERRPRTIARSMPTPPRRPSAKHRRSSSWTTWKPSQRTR